jgi:hypothetical protein
MVASGEQTADLLQSAPVGSEDAAEFLTRLSKLAAAAVSIVTDTATISWRLADALLLRCSIVNARHYWRV